MSLMEDFKDECVILEKKRIPDGEGGWAGTEWTEGTTFSAAIVLNTSIEARRAEKEGVSSLYTITTDTNATLEYHDVFRRVRDGKVFRVTSDGDDKITPKRASFQVSQVTAEEWEPPR